MKTILTIISLSAATTLVNAQGWISFSAAASAIKTNSASYYVQTGGTSANVPTLANGGIFYYALLYSATAPSGGLAPTNSAWLQPTLFGTSTFVMATNGTLSTGTLQGPANGQFASSLTASTPSYIEVVGWSASLGSTFTQVQGELTSGNWIANGFFGWDGGNLTITPTAASPGPTVIPGIYGNGTLVLYSVTTPVPEPSTMALAGLGGLALLLFRRRK